MRLLFSLLLLSAFLPEVSAQDFSNLLEGSNLSHWMKPNGDSVSGGWQVTTDGILHLKGRGGNIVTRELYGDFELWFEFKIAKKGNGGLKYRVKQYEKSWLGLEYQVLDDDAYPKLTRDHLTASLYNLAAPIPSVTRFNPDGEFNVGKIRVQNQRVQHWINGQLTVNQRLSGPDWQERVASSKFDKYDDFGENVLGHIMLTDHKSETWYRNVFIRRLGDSSPACHACFQ